MVRWGIFLMVVAMKKKKEKKLCPHNKLITRFAQENAPDQDLHSLLEERFYQLK